MVAGTKHKFIGSFDKRRDLMSRIAIKNDRILFYGNVAGYISENRAIVDPIFQCDELKDYLAGKKGLEVEWTNGVFEKIANGGLDQNGEAQILKNCRIHQLKPEVDVMMKFIDYEDLLERFGEPNPKNYQVVYDGQLETNNLDAIFEKFNLHHPPGYRGHSLSMSDIIELYDSNGSSFHYIDRFGFREIGFQPPEQEHQNGQTMKL
jgi:hypothetical protein